MSGLRRPLQLGSGCTRDHRNTRILLCSLKKTKWELRNREPQEYSRNLARTYGPRWVYSYYLPTIFLGFTTLGFTFSSLGFHAGAPNGCFCKFGSCCGCSYNRNLLFGVDITPPIAGYSQKTKSRSCCYALGGKAGRYYLYTWSLRRNSRNQACFW